MKGCEIPAKVLKNIYLLKVSERVNDSSGTA